MIAIAFGRIAVMAVAASGLASLAVFTPHDVHAGGNFVVDRLTDDAPVALECTGGGHPCSLRQAFHAAQAGAVGGAITFSVQGQINLASTIAVNGTETITVNGGSSASSIVIDGGGLIEPLTFGMTTGHPSVTLTNLSVQHGLGSSDGGGMYNGGTLTLQDDVVQNNLVMIGATLTANGGGLSAGGGSTTTIIASTFTGNVTNGGAFAGPPIIPSFGGAISIFNGGSLAVVNSTIEGNTVLGNPMDEGGGVGLLCCGTTASIVNSTIDGNAAPVGAGVAADGGTGGASATFKNDIVSGNTGGNNCAKTNAGTITLAGHNLEQGSSSCGFDVNGDPKLGTLNSNGGPTPTQQLLAGSAAIDAGDNTTCNAAPVNNGDQRGDPRIQSGDPICDLGAFEVQPTATPTPTTAPTPSVPPTGAATGPATLLLAVLAATAAMLLLARLAARRLRP